MQAYFIMSAPRKTPYWSFQKDSGQGQPSATALTCNRRRWPPVGLMLGQRLRRWTSIKPAGGNDSTFWASTRGWFHTYFWFTQCPFATSSCAHSPLGTGTLVRTLPALRDDQKLSADGTTRCVQLMFSSRWPNAGSTSYSPSGWNRFQPQIDRVQYRGTFL